MKLHERHPDYPTKTLCGKLIKTLARNNPESCVADAGDERVDCRVCLSTMPLVVGTPVRKISGHAFVGVIVSRFQNLKGENRMVVESTARGAEGLLFIFRPDQVTYNRSAGNKK